MLGLEGGTGKKAITRWNLARCLPYEDLHAAKALGLDQYEVRSFPGWSRHITLVLLAAAFLLNVTLAHALADPSSPPLIPLTLSEARHLLAHLFFSPPTSVPLLLHWSRFRRTHQYWAGYYHRRRRAKAG